MKLAIPISAREDIALFTEKGADVLIVGVMGLAHRMNHTFSLEELPQLIYEIKKTHASVWINVNRILFEDDLPLLTAAFALFQSLPIDGILYADLAWVLEAKKQHCLEKMIYYPETYTMNFEDVNYWYKQGIQSVVLGRELTLEELGDISSKTSLPLTLVGHGYLNMFHSKRRLLSHYLTYIGTSPKNHLLSDGAFNVQEITREDHYKISEDASGTHLFRAKPLASFAALDRLKDGIDTMMIDTLFFDTDAAKNVLSDYRQALLSACRDGWIDAYRKTHDDGFYHKKTLKMKRSDRHD